MKSPSKSSIWEPAKVGFSSPPTNFRPPPFHSEIFFLGKTLQNAGNTSNKQIPRFIALAEPVRRRGKCRSWSNVGKNQWNPYYGTIQPYRGLWWDLVGKSIKTHWKHAKSTQKHPKSSAITQNALLGHISSFCARGACVGLENLENLKSCMTFFERRISTRVSTVEV